jgi:membrane protease YdiL (CAAX protease family)
MSQPLKESLVLFILGMFGVLTILAVQLPPMPEEVTAQFSASTLRLLVLVQPAVLLVLAALSGAYLGRKVGLRAPFIEGVLSGKADYRLLSRQLQIGLPLGFAAGLLLALATQWAMPMLPSSFADLQSQISAPPITRFLYGGITEEVLMRWGLMGFLAWLFWKMAKAQPNGIYWAAIIITAFLFGLGHLPVLFISVEAVTPGLVFFIIFANMFFGLIAGWLFWKHGLEAAIIAHVFAHVGMMVMGG